MNHFKHHDRAQFNSKIERLIRDWDWQAYGLYWAIVELYIAFDSGLTYEEVIWETDADYDEVRPIVEDYDLFEIDENGVFKPREDETFSLIKQ